MISKLTSKLTAPIRKQMTAMSANVKFVVKNFRKKKLTAKQFWCAIIQRCVAPVFCDKLVTI